MRAQPHIGHTSVRRSRGNNVEARYRRLSSEPWEAGCGRAPPWEYLGCRTTLHAPRTAGSILLAPLTLMVGS